MAASPKHAFQMFEKRFKCKQRHAQAPSYLRKLSFSRIKEERNYTDMDALPPANAHIFQYISQCGPSYKDEYKDGQMCDFLAQIVDKEEWALHNLSTRLTSHGTKEGVDYDTMYSMLISALTLIDDLVHAEDRKPNAVFYGEKYGNPPHRKGHKSFRSNRKKHYRNGHTPRSPSDIAALKARTLCIKHNTKRSLQKRMLPNGNIHD